MLVLACGPKSADRTPTPASREKLPEKREPQVQPQLDDGKPDESDFALPGQPAKAGPNVHDPGRTSSASSVALHTCVISRPAMKIAEESKAIRVLAYDGEVFALVSTPVGTNTRIELYGQGHGAPSFSARAETVISGCRVPGGLALGTHDSKLVIVVAACGVLYSSILPVPNGHGSQPPLTLSRIATNVDSRFAPVVLGDSAMGPGLQLAFVGVRADGTRGRIMSTDANARPRSIREINLPGMGASSPTAARSSDGTRVYFIDARSGVSPVLRSDVDNVAVERSLTNVREPAEIVAIPVGDDTFLAYTAVGTAASSAIGLVKLGEWDAPVAIVPGHGYGPVRVAATSLDRDTGIIVALRPSDTPASSPREVIVRVLDRDGLGADRVVALGGTSIDATAVTANGTTQIAVAFTTEDDSQIAWLDCRGAT